MTLSSILDRAYKSAVEWHSGKIQRDRWIWRWYDGALPDSVQQQFDKGKNQAILIDPKGNSIYRKIDGRIARTEKGQSVDCPNFNLWPGKVPMIFEKRSPMVNVSYSECKKCQFYQSPKDGKENYAVCKWAKEQRSGSEAPRVVASRKIAEGMSDALNSAAKMMHG